MKSRLKPTASRRLMIVVIATLFSLASWAQKVTISGEVKDSQQEPLIGATVMEKGSSNGVVTDYNGHFSITVEKGATLRFSSIGFTPREMKATNGMTVVLADDTNLLEEVVAIGYGSVKRKDVTTAVSSVSTKDLESRPIVSAAQGMQGKAAGLQIM